VPEQAGERGREDHPPRRQDVGALAGVRLRRQVGCGGATLLSDGTRKAEYVTPRSPPEFLEAEGAELASGIGRYFRARGVVYCPLVPCRYRYLDRRSRWRDEQII
jgi:hypothetical protein